MNIWIVNQYSMPPSHPGITRHYEFAQQLIKRGHSVKLICQDYLHSSKKRPIDLSGQPYLEQDIDGVDFMWVHVNEYSGNGVGRVVNMAQFAKRVLRHAGKFSGDAPDIIIGSSPSPFAANAARKLAKKYKVPFVLEVRDLWPQTFIDLGEMSKWHPFILLLKHLEKKLYRGANAIISVLPNSIEYIANIRGSSSNIHFIPNGCTLADRPWEEPTKNNSTFKICYAGSMGLSNSLDTLIDAAIIIKQRGNASNIRIALCGQGTHKSELVKKCLLAELGFIEFIDPLPKSAIHSFLVTADAFVVTMKETPLYQYGISFNKIFDYLAMGRPIVTATCATKDPVVESGAGFAVKAEDPGQLADALEDIAKLSIEKRKELGRRGRDWVLRNNSFASLSDRLEEALESANCLSCK
ncbi:glycosyltransferase family 4 protein [Planctomycetota bacterium]|nr:glycosyltransferase family 4 protein [Planctomycetota bacterium]